MSKTIRGAALALVLGLGGCAWLQKAEEYRVPVDQAATIAQQVADILNAADLNDDGYVQGATEWLVFVSGVYDAVQPSPDEPPPREPPPGEGEIR